MIQTLVYALMLYSMIGFEWTAVKFFYFHFFMFACYAYCSFFGMMLVALTPAIAFAGILMSFFINFWNLFSGFIISRVVSKFFELFNANFDTEVYLMKKRD